MMATLLSETPSLTEAEIKKYQKQIGDLKSEYQTIPLLENLEMHQKSFLLNLNRNANFSEDEGKHQRDLLN